MTRNATRFVPGWIIVAFTAASQFVSVGVGYYTFGVYLKPLTEALDTDRFLISLALSMQTLLMAVLGPLVGRLLTEVPIRRLMISGALLMSAGLIVCSQATQLWHLYLGYGLLLSPGCLLTGNLPCSYLLANWFVRRRGSAIGISQFGVTISGTILVPVASMLVESVGWRQTFLVFAAFTSVILIPLVWRFAVKTPEEVGLHPDGVEPAPQPHSALAEPEWNFARALRTKDVWLISLIAGPCYMAIGAVVLAMHSHATDLGLSATRASSIVALTTLMGAIAKPTMGILADLIAKRLVVALALALQVAGVLVVIFARDYNMLMLAGFLFGLGYGGIAPLWSILLAERFGRLAFARVMGAAMPLTMPFTLLALPVTTLAYETTGSYVPAFVGMLACYVISAVCLFLLRLPSEDHRVAP